MKVWSAILAAFLLLNFVCARALYAAGGVVSIIKGQAVFMPENGSKVELTKGQAIEGNGTLATNKKSLLQLKMQDGTVLSLGAETTMNVAQSLGEKPKVLTLLQGKVRAIVDEKLKMGNGHKMYIKTRTAALGVRGTDFLIVHNPKNHVTSTVTFKGQVNLFKKLDEDIHESLREEFDKKRGKAEFYQERDTVNLEDDLQRYGARAVAPGQVSGAFPGHEQTGEAIKLSPEQFRLLAQNDVMETDTEAKGRVVGVTDKRQKGPSNDLLVPKPPKDEAVPDSRSDYNKKKSGHIRAGGVLDLETGYYLAPPADATYDEKTGTYQMPSQFGSIDSKTGEYHAPEGLRLDPLFGFVPRLGIGPDYEERDVKKIFAKLKNMEGGYDEKIYKSLKVFKELSRLDIYGFVNYRFTTNAMENYYGERRAITQLPTMLWDGKILGGFQLYHGPTWMHYPKASWSTLYHDRNIPAIQRNDALDMMFGWESHYKHYLFNKKARFVFDFEFNTRYMDYKKHQRYDFYTEDAGVKISERFQFNRNHLSELYYRVRAFQGYHDPNHGNIHDYGFTHRFFLGRHLDFQLRAEQSSRKEQWTNNRYKRTTAGGEGIWVDMLPRLNLTGGYTWEWLYYQFEQKTLSRYQEDPYWPNENLKKGFMYRAHMGLDYRLGGFWKIQGLYEYVRQRTTYGAQNRAFIQQTWGGGLTMFF